jgi:hypothetical protein
MTPWSQRSREERALLNPGFCANILWHAARGYGSVNDGRMSFEESFLILPLVLHREIREVLPRDTRTSLAVWLDNNPLARGKIADRAHLLVPFTKEALTFAGVRGFIHLNGAKLHGEPAWKKSVNVALKESSDEVRICSKRADFVGRWFAQTGSPTTVLALMGVRP